MPDKLNKQGRQTTTRESDGCIVPPKPEVQSGGPKSGNTDVGKAARISRDPDRTPTVLSDGESVAAIVWVYGVVAATIIWGAVYVARLDHGTRTDVLIWATYILVPTSVLLGLVGRHSTRLGWMLILTVFVSGFGYPVFW